MRRATCDGRTTRELGARGANWARGARLFARDDVRAMRHRETHAGCL